ncbi:MAG: alkaline phosphatase family protein [Verrucomicrobia bacterium]|nr:alkaline phosphatase family protein [Verrucomicrobiota bacterium]
MPLITSGVLRGFYAPEYRGNSIVNLLASLLRARGGRSPHPGLEGFPAGAFRAARRAVYLVLDGLGEYQLQWYLKQAGKSPFFAAHPRQVITTVFPATTAAAVTTFATGAPPYEHGILGWHLHLGDLGMVSTILMGVTRTGTPMAKPDFPLKEYLRLPSYLESVPGRRSLISYGAIPDSRYSRAGLRWHESSACTTLTGLVRQVVAFARGRGRALAYAYWPGLDSLCHEWGCFHAKTMRHMIALDGAMARLCAALKKTGTALVVTADHGLVDTPPERCIELRDVPGFYDCLAMLPSGDAREVSCFVRPARLNRFRGILRTSLRHACACVEGDALVQGGFFGRGKQHPALSQRVGDFVLIAREGYAFNTTPPGMRSGFKRGNHGGMSPEEMRVPLYVMTG